MLPAQRLLLMGRSGLVSSATAILGTTPYHYWDFMSDRAIFAGKDVGAVTATPGWSFTRASTGFANQVPNTEFGSTNLVLQSQTFDNASWANAGQKAWAGGSTANATAAPDGTTTADLITEDSTTGRHFSTQSHTTVNAAVYTYSVYVKAGTRTSVMLGLRDNGGGTGFGAVANLSAGTISTTLSTGSPTSTGSAITALANGWYRVSVTMAAVSTTTRYELGISDSPTPAYSNSMPTYTGDNASGLYVWGAQAELGTSPTTYKPTTTVAVTDVSGPPLVSFGSGVLRRTNKGALIEGASTNLCLQSQTFENAYWTASQSTVSANSIAAPDGTTTADTVTRNVTSGSEAILRNITTLSISTVYTASVYAKAGTVNFLRMRALSIDGATLAQSSAYFNISTGTVGTKGSSLTSSSIQSLGGGWFRCIVTWTTTGTITNNNFDFAIEDADDTSPGGTSGDAIYLWGAQIEASAYPTSYVPTTTASATRAADVATVSPPGVTYPLSLQAEFERVVDTGADENTINVWFNLSNNAMLRVSGPADLSEYAVTAGGATVATETVAGALALATPYKQAVRVQTNDFKGARGGTLTTGDTVGALPTNPTSIAFGARSDGVNWSYGYLRSAAIFNSALNDAALQRATT